MEEFETTNIHFDWLKIICEQLKAIQSMQRIAKEGCESMAEYLEIPYNLRPVILPDAQYKNMRFFALELDLILDNLKPILKDNEAYKGYKKNLELIILKMDNRNLFLKDKYSNGELVEINVLPLLNKFIILLSQIKSQIILDIGNILYLQEDNLKKW